MNELLKVNYDNERITLSARELHEFLEVKSKYADWFKNMSAYGFEENIDYQAISKNLENGGRKIDHQITLDMAKEIAMIQRS
ncbi:antA/AntB antirepressor family protein [Longicatena caecimuris]|mgnify:CR=1 FL=1|uniref:antA/AntB antirepressor family protein n=1 Tax=Longicatena caecimuris TaxID=1796635 RepID=UPI0018AA444F|nr:antA/AntB antirepressor family protein [Longicatena caecimuris]